MIKYISLLLVLILSGCVGIPENIKPVNEFALDRYLGTWYEIARLDNSFEKGLSKVTANYSMREDGGVKVINRGYSIEKKDWKEAEGKAYFVKSPDIGYLKVSFFGPFYGSYIVFDLDHEKYQYSLISGADKSYFWLLARTPKIDDDVKAILIAKAAGLGFDTSKLLFVDQE